MKISQRGAPCFLCADWHGFASEAAMFLMTLCHHRFC